MNWDIGKYHLVSILLDNHPRYFFNESYKHLTSNSLKLYYAYKTSKKFRIHHNPYGETNNNRNYFCEKTGWIGCVSSFYGMIQYAKMNNWPYIFCFEDDLLINPRASQIINERLDKNFQGILLLSYNQTKRRRHCDNITRLSINEYVSGGYAMLITKHLYDKILILLNNCNVPPYRDTFYLKPFVTKYVWLWGESMPPLFKHFGDKCSTIGR